MHESTLVLTCYGNMYKGTAIGGVFVHLHKLFPKGNLAPEVIQLFLALLPPPSPPLPLPLPLLPLFSASFFHVQFFRSDFFLLGALPLPSAGSS